jgi:hypothetical protein
VLQQRYSINRKERMNLPVETLERETKDLADLVDLVDLVVEIAQWLMLGDWLRTKTTEVGHGQETILAQM